MLKIGQNESWLKAWLDDDSVSGTCMFVAWYFKCYVALLKVSRRHNLQKLQGIIHLEVKTLCAASLVLSQILCLWRHLGSGKEPAHEGVSLLLLLLFDIFPLRPRLPLRKARLPVGICSFVRPMMLGSSSACSLFTAIIGLEAFDSGWRHTPCDSMPWHYGSRWSQIPPFKIRNLLRLTWKHE